MRLMLCIREAAIWLNLCRLRNATRRLICWHASHHVYHVHIPTVQVIMSSEFINGIGVHTMNVSSLVCDAVTGRSDVIDHKMGRSNYDGRMIAWGWLLLVLVVAPAHGFTEELIKCKVCERAVSHVWGKGVALRHHCLVTKGPDRDVRCDFHDIQPHAIDQMVWGVCDVLPTTYKAIHESEFDLVLHEDPQHPEELAKLIASTCIKYVHKHHGAEILGEKIQRHLQHSHGPERLEPIVRDVCSHVCKAPPPTSASKPRRYAPRPWTPPDDEL